MTDGVDHLCVRCGACCVGTLLPLVAHESDNDYTLPDDLVAELRTLAYGDVQHDDRAPCVWLDAKTKRCRHYDQRPPICRTALVPGDESCRELRRNMGVE